MYHTNLTHTKNFSEKTAKISKKCLLIAMLMITSCLKVKNIQNSTSCKKSAFNNKYITKAATLDVGI
jgi:hypothetical protein